MPLLRSRLRGGTYFTFVAVLVVIGLCIIFGLEWKYIDNLKEEDDDFSNRKPKVLTRPSAGQNQNKALSSSSGVNFSRESHNVKGIGSHLDSKEDIPGNIYKILRRRKQQELVLAKSIQELWWYTRKSVKILSAGKNKVDSDQLLKNIAHRYSSLQWRYAELAEYQSNSGQQEINWKYWQVRVSQQLNTIMEKRIHQLQNPVDCKSAKKLVCHVAKACGFGCQIHHVSYCFILAYATQRTLILDSSSWKYSPNGWNVVFKPISSTCVEIPKGIVSDTVYLSILFCIIPY